MTIKGEQPSMAKGLVTGTHRGWPGSLREAVSWEVPPQSPTCFLGVELIAAL